MNCELDYELILREIAKPGYCGNVGLEYRPTLETSTSLRETKK